MKIKTISLNVSAKHLIEIFSRMFFKHSSRRLCYWKGHKKRRVCVINIQKNKPSPLDGNQATLYDVINIRNEVYSHWTVTIQRRYVLINIHELYLHHGRVCNGES